MSKIALKSETMFSHIEMSRTLDLLLNGGVYATFSIDVMKIKDVQFCLIVGEDGYERFTIPKLDNDLWFFMFVKKYLKCVVQDHSYEITDFTYKIYLKEKRKYVRLKRKHAIN